MKTRIIKPIKQAWPDFLTGGIFQRMATVGALPWAGSVMSDADLDLDYYMNHSGDKPIGHIINEFLTQDVTEDTTWQELQARTLTAEQENAIARLVYGKNVLNWRRLWALVEAEYNPIENYNMIERETGSGTSSTTTSGETERTDNATTTDNGSETFEEGRENTVTGRNTTSNEFEETDRTTTTETGSKNGSRSASENGTANESSINLDQSSNMGYVSGFNSTSLLNNNRETDRTDGNAQKSSSSNNATTETDRENTTNEATENLHKTGENSGTETKSETGTESTESTKTTRDTVTEARTGTEETSGSSNGTTSNQRQLTRSGNIGVTTSAQMIEQEIELWKWNFFSRVMSDIDKTLASGVYY